MGTVNKKIITNDFRKTKRTDREKKLYTRRLNIIEGQLSVIDIVVIF